MSLENKNLESRSRRPRLNFLRSVATKPGMLFHAAFLILLAACSSGGADSGGGGAVPAAGGTAITGTVTAPLGVVAKAPTSRCNGSPRSLSARVMRRQSIAFLPWQTCK